MNNKNKSPPLRRGGPGRGAQSCDHFKILMRRELLAKVNYSVIPAKAGIQNRLKTLDSGSRFACPE